MIKNHQEDMMIELRALWTKWAQHTERITHETHVELPTQQIHMELSTQQQQQTHLLLGTHGAFCEVDYRLGHWSSQI